MSTSTGQGDIDRVRDATDLVRLVGEHVALRPRGREHVGLCPFHEDHRPSLAVVTHKGHGFYHCFACGASGDCFRFVMAYHKMEFGEALRFLAERAGIALSPRRERPAPGTGAAPRRDDLRRALTFAQAFFRRTFDDRTLGAAARAELERRGIDAPMIERFQLGAAPRSSTAFRDLLGGKSSALRTARAAGLLRQPPGGGDAYDTFRHRLIFPIWDDVGRIIAFGGRVLDPGDRPKYLNSPESPLFDKSRMLYGLHQARRAIIDSGEAIVTEGYTDVITCHQVGIINVVGTLGTALTHAHATGLSRLCDTVVLVFDGDEAGQKAADRGVEVFFREPVDVRICVLPDGQDPDELLRSSGGPERFRAAVGGAIEALEYKLRRFEAGLEGVPGLSARQKRLERFLAELADLGFGALQGVRKRLVMTHLADLLKVPMAELEGAIPRPRRRAAPTLSEPSSLPPRPPVAGAPSMPTDSTDPAPASLLPGDEGARRGGPCEEPSRARRIAERDLLALVLVDPAAALQARLAEAWQPEDFIDPASRQLAAVLLRPLAAGQTFDIAQILGQLPGGAAAALAAALFREGRGRVEADEEPAAVLVASAAAALRACLEHERYQRQTSRFRGPDLEAVLERIRQRHEHGDLPAAISAGVRST